MMSADVNEHNGLSSGKKKNLFKMISDSVMGVFEKFTTSSGILQAFSAVSNKRK
jgi:hypothetical protein